jgi:hypothetical protein
MKLHTVNVIEIINDDFKQIVSFTDDEEGNHEAETLFEQMATKNGAESEDMESHLDDGCFLKDTYQLLLTHSYNA